MKQLNFGSTNGVPNDPNKTVVHCPTQELAQKVLRIADEYGLTWNSGQAYTSYNPWDIYNSTTCYSLVRGLFLTTETYSGQGYTILPAEEFIRLNTPIEQPNAEERNPFAKGDRVYDVNYGWGIVDKIYDGVYPICVDFENANRKFYSLSGVLGGDYTTPTLSFTEYTLQGFSQERPKPEIKHGQLIYVRGQENSEWRMRYFKRCSGSKVVCYDNQNQSGSCSTWPEYSLTNPLEEK